MDTNSKTPDNETLSKEKEQSRGWLSKVFGSTGLLLVFLLLLALLGTYLVPAVMALYKDAQPFGIQESASIAGGVWLLTATVLTLLSLLAPWQCQRQALPARIWLRPYVEIKLALVGAVLGAAYLGSAFLLAPLLQNLHIERLPALAQQPTLLYYFVSVGGSFLGLITLYLGITFLKYSCIAGPRRAWIQNSLIYAFWTGTWQGFSSLLTQSHKNLSESLRIPSLRTPYRRQLKALSSLLMGIGAVVVFFPRSMFFTLLVGGFLWMIYRQAVGFLKYLSRISENAFDLSQGKKPAPLDTQIKPAFLAEIASNLNDVSDHFERAVREEVKSRDMKTQLIANVSHDLKTPLTSIITYVDLLRESGFGKETPKQLEYLDVIDRKSRRMEVLIEDLFEATKATTGNIELHLEDLDVIALFRQAMGELQEKIEQRELTFRLHLPEEKVICHLDGRKTFRIFENIISNLLKYSLPGTRVYISAIRNDQKVIFEFRNIASYEMKFDSNSIFERFVRGDTSRTTEGSGLGLAIAKSLTELQGGQLQVQTEADLFKLFLTFPEKSQPKEPKYAPAPFSSSILEKTLLVKERS